MAQSNGLAVYAARWDDGDISLVVASCLEMLAAVLDPIGSPIGIEIRRLQEKDVDGMSFRGTLTIKCKDTYNCLNMTPSQSELKNLQANTFVDRDFYIDDEGGYEWDKFDEKFARGELVKITTKHLGY